MRSLPSGRPSRSCEHEFILSCASRPFRVRDRFEPVWNTEVTRQPSPSSAPHRDTSSASPLAASFPPLTYGPSSAFLTLSTAYSSQYLAGLFDPAATSGIHPSGISPLPSQATSSVVCALLSLMLLVYREVTLPRPTPSTSPPGLQSRQRSVVNNRGISPIHCPFPS